MQVRQGERPRCDRHDSERFVVLVLLLLEIRKQLVGAFTDFKRRQLAPQDREWKFGRATKRVCSR